MVSRQRWMEFFVRHFEQHSGGVIDRLLGDWHKAIVDADIMLSAQMPAPSPGHNRDSPRCIARMLAERIRRQS